MSKKCPFCGSTIDDLSKEHLWPDWMRGLIPGKRKSHPAVEHRIENRGQVVRRYPAVPFTLEVGGFCEKRCNNGWMSDIEKEAKPILVPLITMGKARVLSENDQSVLSRWLAMKAMVFQLTMDYHPIPENQYRYLYLHKRPYISQRVWIAARGDRNPESVWGLHGVIAGTSKDDPERHHLYMTTFVLGNLVMEMFGHDLPQTIEFKRGGSYGPAFEPIWPVAGPVEWPPKYVIRSANHFAKNASIDDDVRVALSKVGITILKS